MAQPGKPARMLHHVGEARIAVAEENCGNDRRRTLKAGYIPPNCGKHVLRKVPGICGCSRRRGGLSGLVVLAVVFLSATPIFAQPKDDQKAAADALFHQGLNLMKTGQYQKACELFSASHRFDPSVGALLNLGNCRERLGQFATAFAFFDRARHYAERTGDKRRARYAQRRMARLETKLSYLTVVVASEAFTPGLEILQNGTLIPDSLWNQAIPIDPGVWTIRAQKPAAKPFETQIDVSLKQHVTVRIPALAPSVTWPFHDGRHATGSVEKTFVPLLGYAPFGIDETRHHPMRSGFPWTRKLALAGVAFGAVSLAGGGLIGWRARRQYQDAKAICDNDNILYCSDDERRLSQQGRDQARSTANVATWSWILGATFASAGAVLWIANPGSQSAVKQDRAARTIQPVVDAHTAGVRMHMRF